MSRPPIQDKYTVLYDKLQDKGKKAVARILYELRRYDRGLCVYPGCNRDKQGSPAKYCEFHVKVLRDRQRMYYRRAKKEKHNVKQSK